eukprot:3855560-Amphidinium_carterae.1
MLSWQQASGTQIARNQARHPMHERRFAHLAMQWALLGVCQSLHKMAKTHCVGPCCSLRGVLQPNNPASHAWRLQQLRRQDE